MPTEQEKQLAKEIKRVYKQAAKETQKKLADFINGHRARNQKMLQYVRDGVLSESDYQHWLKGQVFQEKQWKEKVKDVTQIYLEADKKAHDLVNGTAEDVFVDVANHTAYDIEKDFKGGVSFNIYDERTVERLLRDDPQVLPKWKINEPKDYIWNQKRVQNSVLQGIIQGESIAEIGQRLTTELATSNEKKMRMFARTAMTGAQNAGRMQRLRETESMGIEVRKKWLATLDSRTRDAHRDLDGQERKVNENFESDDGEIAYPGDPTAPARLVYNCRCTLTYVYPQYQHLQQNHQRYDQENKEYIPNMTYRRWERWKKGELTEIDQKQKNKKMQFSDIKNFNDVVKYFKDEYDIKVWDSVGKLDFDKTRPAFEGIDDVLKKFPILKKRLNNIGTDVDGYMSTTDGHDINFTPQYWGKDYKQWDENFAYHSGAHEAGHCLDSILCRHALSKDKDLLESFTGKKLEDAIEYWTKEYLHAGKQAKKIVNVAIKNIKKEHPEFKNFTPKDFKHSISDYAMTASRETIAEAVGSEMLREKKGISYYRGRLQHLFGQEIFSIVQKEIEAIDND